MTGENHIRAIEIALTQGDTSAALEIATSGLKASPDSLELKLWMGIANDMCGETAKALSIFELAHQEALKKDASLHIKGKLKYALATSYLKINEHRQAASLLQEAVEIFPNNPILYETLVRVTLELGLANKAREYGQLLIELLDFSVDAIEEKSGLPTLKRPRLFNPKKPETNIIAFSLYGSDKLHQECALDNARKAIELFPEFTARFYCDSGIPVKTRKALTMYKAELKVISAKDSEYEPGFWNLMAFDDPKVNLVLVRNVLAPLSEKEHGLVKKWLFGSPKPFYTIRDSLLDCTPLPENMWAGFTGLFSPVGLVSKLIREKPEARLTHQQFLLRHIWPRIRKNCFVHDSNYTLGNSIKPKIQGRGPVDKDGKEQPVGWFPGRN